jgi:hypothetical protein
MTRLLFAVAFLVAAAATAQDRKKDDEPKKSEPKGTKVDFANHTGHFVKTDAKADSGSKADVSYLFIPDRATFDRHFGIVPPPGFGAPGGGRVDPVQPRLFDSRVVLAVIKRGKGPITYTVESITEDGGTLTVRYKAESGKEGGGTATFASPMLVSIPRVKATKAVFVENGKEVGTAEPKAEKEDKKSDKDKEEKME